MKSAFLAATGALALVLSLPATASLPQPKTDHGIAYLSGGIGADEAAAMKAQEKDYPLNLIFSAGKHSAYLSGVSVDIKNGAGKPVLDTASAGPILLIKLPSGKYRVAAGRHGKTLQRTVVVKAKGTRQVVFHWPEA